MTSKIVSNEEFVRAYQRKYGLTEDGWAGVATFAHLNPAGSSDITERVAMELIQHEAIVQEAYKDSQGIWTWGVGVTSASGHSVERYKDNPQPLAKCLAIYVWLLREKYAPAVRQAFSGRELTEAQFAAALSFHYNTGAIERASWVKTWLTGGLAKAKEQFLEWRRPPAIMGRRRAEADLFFHGKWSSGGLAAVYPVLKPSYQPNFGAGKMVDIRDALKEAMG